MLHTPGPLLQVATSAWAPVARVVDKLRGAKVLDSVRQGAQFVQDELSGTSKRKPRRLTQEEIEERERLKGEESGSFNVWSVKERVQKGEELSLDKFTHSFAFLSASAMYPARQLWTSLSQLCAKLLSFSVHWDLGSVSVSCKGVMFSEDIDTMMASVVDGRVWILEVKPLAPGACNELLPEEAPNLHPLVLQPSACRENKCRLHNTWRTLTSFLPAAAEEAKLGPKSEATSVVIVPKKQSRWERRREEIYEKLKQNPVFQRIYGFGSYAKPVLQKGQEIVEDVQEKWETSPSPTVERMRVRS